MPINNTVALCGARAKQNNHQPCRQPAMKNGRCRLHGGKSTGAKTEAGKQRKAQLKTTHGYYTKQAYADRKKTRIMLQWRKDLEGV